MSSQRDNPENALINQGIFSLASNDIIKKAGEVARHAKFGPGEYLCFQGDPQSPLVLLISGQLRLFTLSENGFEVPMGVINAGQSSGEPAILCDSPSMLNIAAVRHSAVALIGRNDARQLFNEPQVSRALNTIMAQRFTHHIERHAVQGLPRADARISAVIEAVINDAGTNESPLIELPNQATIAALAKVSRETVSRVLKSLEQRGVLAKEGQWVRVCDRTTLRSLAAG